MEKIERPSAKEGRIIDKPDTRSHAECQALRPLLLAFKAGFQGADDALFQPGDITLADAKGIGGFLLGALHAVGKAKAQFHDLPLPCRERRLGAAQHGALGVLLQLLA